MIYPCFRTVYWSTTGNPSTWTWPDCCQEPLLAYRRAYSTIGHSAKTRWVFHDASPMIVFWIAGGKFGSNVPGGLWGPDSAVVADRRTIKRSSAINSVKLKQLDVTPLQSAECPISPVNNPRTSSAWGRNVQMPKWKTRLQNATRTRRELWRDCTTVTVSRKILFTQRVEEGMREAQ